MTGGDSAGEGIEVLKVREGDAVDPGRGGEGEEGGEGGRQLMSGQEEVEVGVRVGKVASLLGGLRWLCV